MGSKINSKHNDGEQIKDQEETVKVELENFLNNHKEFLEGIRDRWNSTGKDWSFFKKEIKERFSDKKIKSILRVGLTYEFEGYLITVKFNQKTFIASYKSPEVVFQKEKIDKKITKPGVYHVANPNIRGEILNKRGEHHCEVLFDEKVSFSGNTMRPPSKLWVCSLNLLFSSPEEALANHDPNHD